MLLRLDDARCGDDSHLCEQPEGLREKQQCRYNRKKIQRCAMPGGLHAGVISPAMLKLHQGEWGKPV
jgi:hypothetical protein